MSLTPQEVFDLCRKQCKDNLHIFWWEFLEEELLAFVKEIEKKTMQPLIDILNEQQLILADSPTIDPAVKEEKYFKWARLNNTLRTTIKSYEV